VRVIRLAADVWRRLNVDALRRSFAAVTSRTAGGGALDDGRAQDMARRLNAPPLTGGEIQALLSRPDGELGAELQSLARRSLWPSLRPWNLWTDAQRGAAARTEAKLRGFSEDVAADGGRLVVVYVPNPLQIGGNECSVGRFFERVDANVVLPPGSGIQTWLQGIAARHGIEVLDPSEAMRQFEQTRAAAGAGPLYLRADCHWSERGHEFMASYLADWLDSHSPELKRRNGMLK
jgi:hypothetical protein